MARDFLLKMEPQLKGESKQKGFEDWIEIDSWSWAVSNSGAGGRGFGQSQGKANFNDFHFTKQVDKATVELMLVCANGKHFDKATLVCRRAGETPQTYQTVIFHDVFMSSFTPGGGGGDNVSESISFNFSKVEMEYQPMDNLGKPQGGPVKQGFDLKQGQKV
jgi:type VI secretion system secreted protein Hcp